MWNFDECKEKLALQYRENNWDEQSGTDYDTLEKYALRMIDKGRDDSSVKVKTDLLCYFLRNAQVEVNPDEIFADKLNCKSIIWKHHLSMHKKHVMENEAGAACENALPLSETGTIVSDMDFGHISPDWDFIMKNGIPGIIDRLERNRTEENREFYDCSIEAYRAIADFMLRLAESAGRNKCEKSDFTAENLVFLTKSAPETLAQAMQLTLIVYTVQTEHEMSTVRSLGGLDRLYYPFYKSDIESGRFTEKQLREIIRDFFWKISSMKVTANMPFSICGKNPDGSDATNKLTRVLLEEYRKLDIYDPKIHVMYHENIDPEIVELILDMIRSGNNSFVFMNTGIIEKSLLKIGVEPEDAKRITVYGCYEAAAEGTEVPATCAGRVNIVKSIEFALNNGIDTVNGKQAGITTGDDFESFGDFYKAVKIQIKHILEICMDTISAFEPHYYKVCPAPVISATFKSCVEKGTDIFSGGAKYNNTSVVCAGFATLVDSLIVMKKAVFEEGLVSFDEMKQILKDNWSGREDLRMYCKDSYSKFGNNKAEADSIAADIFSFCGECINNRKNGRGGVFRFGAFSIDWRYYMGKNTCATPDGRFSGETISKNLCSVIGQDKAGVTAYLNSLLRLDAAVCPDGNVADVVLHSSAVAGKSGLKALTGLLKTYMSGGGYAVHFNALNPEELRKAQKEPEKYKNLQVRICGWNARFVELSENEQNEFIKRSEY